jgi:L-rhamnono-1,4-lactonase
MQHFSSFDNVYMKLSGAFSELAEQSHESPMPVKDAVLAMKPWLEVVSRCFGPQRLMFGSDWPVCNVVGPGDELAWRHWVEVANGIMDEFDLSDEQRDMIWYGTAVKAYRLNV